MRWVNDTVTMLAMIVCLTIAFLLLDFLMVKKRTVQYDNRVCGNAKVYDDAVADGPPLGSTNSTGE